MTLVKIKVSVPAVAGLATAVGALRWTPTKRREAGDTVVVPAGFAPELIDGAVNVEAAPTTADWVWRVDEQIPGVSSSTRFFAVPNLAEVNYTDLIEVDPATLVPTADPDPAWYAYVDTLAAQATTASASAVASKTAAESAATSATGSQTSAAASAATATTKASEASTSATNAASSATIASGHKDAAAGSAGAAAGSATAAANAQAGVTASATAAAASDTHATSMATIAQSSASDSIAAANGFSLGTVTTGAPGAAATATITGSAPNKLLNLGLPKGDTGPANVLSIIETVTGPETAGATGPQGPIGAKGDPGGFTLGTLLTVENLNTVMTPGIYRKSTTGTGLLALNFPADTDSGVLLVHVRLTDATVYQEYHTWNRLSAGSRGYYIRTLNAGSWSAWQFVATQRMDQTAGRALYTWDSLNDREQLVYGDTGLRVVSAALTADWLGAGSAAYIRRVGQIVTLQYDIKPTVADTTPANGNFYILPLGFRVSQFGSSADTVVSGERLAINTVTPLIQRLDAAGFVSILVASRAPTDLKFVRGMVSWHTLDAWPTTLPGTASGSIPNT